MLSPHSQFARAWGAFCMAATLALLPGVAWAADYQVTLDPPDGFIIRDAPLLVTATVKSVDPSVPAGVRARPTGTIKLDVGLLGGPDVRGPLPLDSQGRACTQINQADLDKYWSNTWGWNYVFAEYGYDEGAKFAGQEVTYHYDPMRAGAKSPRMRGDGAA